MVPVELVFFVLVALFGLIGLVRGFLKELGVTTVMVIVLFGVVTVDARVAALATKVLKSTDPARVCLWVAGLWAVALAVTAFISYQGQTLAFEGKMPAGALAAMLNLGAGLVNGYLIVGSIWFYLNRAGYLLVPVKAVCITPLAKFLLTLMAPTLLAPFLLYVGLFLVIMRVVR